MTAPSTDSATGTLPYTAPDPADAAVLREAAHLCHLIASRAGGRNSVDLTDRRGEDPHTEYPAPPRWVDLDVLNGLDRHVLRLLGNTFTETAERTAAGDGERADHRAVHAARAITSPAGGRRPADQPPIAYHPDDSAAEPDPSLLALDFDDVPF